MFVEYSRELDFKTKIVKNFRSNPRRMRFRNCLGIRENNERQKQNGAYFNIYFLYNVEKMSQKLFLIRSIIYVLKD